MKGRPRGYARRKLRQVLVDRALPAAREGVFSLIFDERWMGGPISRRIFEASKNFFKLGSIPFFRDRLPEFDPKKNNFSWIPINQDIEGGEGIALAEEVVFRLIEKAKHRVILNYCGCRLSMGCKAYPRDMGCLLMGESALDMPARFSRRVSIEDAKEYVRRGMDLGLIPLTGKTRMDNDLLMTPDTGKLLVVCLCCDCCCITRFLPYMSLQVMAGMHHPVEGLSVQVTDKCIGCGACISKCYIRAIEVKGGQAVHSAWCRVCGRCVMHCPQGAKKLRLANATAADDVVRRIESFVDF
jgi:UDP-glucose 4-epimerase